MGQRPIFRKAKPYFLSGFARRVPLAYDFRVESQLQKLLLTHRVNRRWSVATLFIWASSVRCLSIGLSGRNLITKMMDGTTCHLPLSGTIIFITLATSYMRCTWMATQILYTEQELRTKHRSGVSPAKKSGRKQAAHRINKILPYVSLLSLCFFLFL